MTDMDAVIQENIALKNLFMTVKPELVHGFLARGYHIEQIQEMDMIKAIKRVTGEVA